MHLFHTMPATASIRDLRNHFTKIRKLVQAKGEVLLSESGRIKYRLMLHTDQLPSLLPQWTIGLA